MGTKVGVGISHHRNPATAGQEAVQMALQKGNIEIADFIFMFASVGYEQSALLAAVRTATNNVPLCGCSAEGVIAQDEADESNFSVAVMTICSDELQFQHGINAGLAEDSALIGQQVAAEIQPNLDEGTIGLFVFPDAFTANFEAFKGGLESSITYDRFLPLLGGAASDNLQFVQTYQYYNDQVVSDGVAWALLSGEMKVAWAVNHGCIPIGAPRTITRCEGNIIYEIDHKPALDVLQEYMAADKIEDWASAIGVFSLGFKASREMATQDEYFIRVMLGGVDEATQSVILTTPVTEGDRFWMTRRDYDRIRDGVDQIGQSLKSQLGSNPAKLVFHFECTGRGQMFLRDRQKLQLLNMLQQQIGEDVPWFGLYCHFEVGPMQAQNQLHNYTSVVAALYADEVLQPKTSAEIPQLVTDQTASQQPATTSSTTVGSIYSLGRQLISQWMPMLSGRQIGQRVVLETPPSQVLDSPTTAHTDQQVILENQRLSEQVKQLVETERDLYKTQEQLDIQFRLYRQLYETGKQFNGTFDVDEVLHIATQFVLYGLNFERSLILLSDPEQAVFQVRALDGYYDEPSRRAAEALHLPVETPEFVSLQSGLQQVICLATDDQPQLLALKKSLGMNEFILMSLGDVSEDISGILAIGNSETGAANHTRVLEDSDALVGLANLISQAKTAIKNAAFYTTIEESEKKFRSLFEDSQDAIFISTPAGQFLDVNPAMVTLFGYTQTEMTQMAAVDTYVDPADRIEFREAMEQTGIVRNFEAKLRKNDGTEMDCQLTATAQYDSDGNITVYQGIIRDITLQKQNERLQAENLRLQTELGVAKRLQEMALPDEAELDAVENLDIAGYMEPADEVGGDYYDVLQANGQVKIGIGDVTDHGLESGVVMLMTQTAVRTLLNSGEDDPVRFLDILNRTLYENVQRMNTDRNLTLSLIDYAHSPEKGGQVRLSGQHEEMIVVRRDRSIEVVDTSDLGFPIGIDDDIADFVAEHCVQLQPGDGLVLYTDGITEAENAAGEQYELERLCSLVSQQWDKSATAIKSAVIEDVMAHIGSHTVYDDITLVVVKQK